MLVFKQLFTFFKARCSIVFAKAPATATVTITASATLGDETQIGWF